MVHGFRGVGLDIVTARASFGWSGVRRDSVEGTVPSSTEDSASDDEAMMGRALRACMGKDARQLRGMRGA